uniref:Integrase catalytic domain-containing protein n=1 Tax=Loa loa TaxID=7209 RepID=A0A1I7VQL4_LOALO
MATRGISSTKLRYNRLWWNDPYWLDKDPSQWPNGGFSYNAEDEIIQAVMTNLAKTTTHNYVEDKIQFIEAHRFSKWTKIIKVTVWTLRFIKRFYKRDIPWLKSLSITGADFGFRNEGPNKTNNILMHGLEAMESKTLQIATDAKLTRITSNAIKIIRAGRFRLFGPLSIKSPTGVIKRWIALFTCFTTRAVHLELVEDLSAENFSHIMRRFVARRGYPKLILSDNASQFQLVFKKIMDEKANFLGGKGMIWRNTIPRAPWVVAFINGLLD